LGQASTAALLLIFVYGGYDVVTVPAGEGRNPQRHLPFALITTIIVVTVVMTLCQLITMGTLPNLAGSTTPLADSALVFLGAGGALMIGIGSVISMTGNNAGQILTGSRMLFALAENRTLPPWFGRVHPVYRTPSNAVLFSSAVALALALTGSFVMLAVVSAVARLVTYAGTCAATLILRSERYSAVIKKAEFVVPFGPVIPALAFMISLLIIVGATHAQLLGGAAALIAGAGLYVLNRVGTILRGRSGSPCS
jgi:amino acid transporter